MKKFLLILIISPIRLCSQIYDLDKCGMDTLPQLNINESNLLNYHFSIEDSLNGKIREFDFTNKKVAYLGGSFGKKILDKKSYFGMIKSNPQYHIGGAVFTFLTPEQKKESGGYDVIITLWVKIRRDIDDMIELIKRK